MNIEECSAHTIATFTNTDDDNDVFFGCETDDIIICMNPTKANIKLAKALFMKNDY